MGSQDVSRTRFFIILLKSNLSINIVLLIIKYKLKDLVMKRSLLEGKAAKEALIAVNACLVRYGKIIHQYDLNHLDENITKLGRGSIISEANVISVHVPVIQKKDKGCVEHTLQLFLKVDKEGNPIDYEEFYFSESDRKKYQV